MEIYVKPAEERHLYDDFFELQQVNLTWVATNYSRSTLDIQITWNNISYLSPLPEQDKLVLWIN